MSETAIINVSSLDRPKVMLMGLRRSGKSSICKVVFHNMQPLDTLYIESTSKPVEEEFNSLIDFSVQELPGQLNFFEPDQYIDSDRLFQNVGALVYVIDSQDEYLNALSNLHNIIEYAFKINPNINVEVLIHKVDGLSEDFRLDTQRDIMQRVSDELVDARLDGEVKLNFHLTSIFDHSIYEAFSRVIQKLIPELPVFENLLNVLCSHSLFEKVFLFDVNSKIYVATDSSPVDNQTYEVCTDFIDVAVDLDNLYEGGGSGAKGDTDNTLKCVSKLQNGVTLHLHQMVKGLALVGLIRKENGQKMALVDYNVQVFRQGLERIWDINKN